MQKPQTRHDGPNPYDRYGAGAESKLRLEEATALSAKHASSDYSTVPEGRMRAQEQSRYKSPDVRDIERQHTKPFQEKRQPVPSATKKSQPPKPVAAPVPVATPKNPFDEDDENSDKYDESKNPFADEDDDSPKTEVAKKQDNPFGEYDNNLNPFE